MGQHLIGRRVTYPGAPPGAVGSVVYVWWDDRARNLLALVEKPDGYQWYWATQLQPATSPEW